jgi:hypothetical protein
MRVGYKKPDPNQLAVIEDKVVRENKIIAPPPKPIAIEAEKKETTFLTGAPIKEVDEEDDDEDKKENKFIKGINKELNEIDDEGFHSLGEPD